MPFSRNRSMSDGRPDRLTLAKLASYDDVATDALIDRAYFWTSTRKNRFKYNPSRGIRDDDVAQILLHDVIIGKDVNKAEDRLLAVPGLKKYVSLLPTEREKEWFRRHLRKYIQMYLPDCPFEVTTTNRYTITVHEAAICARKFIKTGKEIKYLAGTLVAMTQEEELDLDLTRKDFSIVMSTRKKTPSFFLGPARFANHDCNANGRLVNRGSEGMQVIATRDIHIGEEVTVSYGESYFGVDNCECLCLTCERAVRNGWSPRVDAQSRSTESTPLEDINEAADSPSPKKRKSIVGSESGSSVLSTPQTRSKLEKRCLKLKDEISLPDIAPALSQPRLLKSLVTDSSVNFYDTSFSSLSLDYTLNTNDESAPVSGDLESSSSRTTDDSLISASTAPTSICDMTVRQLAADSPSLAGHIKRTPGVSDSSAPTGFVTGETPRPKRKYRRRNFQIASVEYVTPRARIPGDYTKTTRLLAHRYDRWVDCSTCSSWFVQPDSYLTRRECPRCERHSKLYGYCWPKTEKEGLQDDEERVMDHREIHRFLRRDEDVKISRRGRGVSLGITPTSEPSDATDASEAGDDERSLRASRRRTRQLVMTS